MADKLAIYQEDKMLLTPVAFVKDIPRQGKVMELSSYELQNQLGHFFTYQIGAYKIKEPMTPQDVTELRKTILSRFKRLSVNEMYYAFQLHRAGEFGEEAQPYGHISISFICRILNMYVEWKQKIRMKNNIPLPGGGLSNQLSEEEKKAYIKSGVLRAYDQWSEHRTLPSGTLYVYDALYDIGLLPTDPEIKRQYYNRARESVKMQMHLEKTQPGLDMRRLREIKDVIEGIEKINNPHVKSQAMRDVVCDYFKTVTREDLTQILNEKV